VGLEAAHYYSSIGSKVTLVSKHGQILHAADRDVAETLARSLTRAGVKIIHYAAIESAHIVKGKKRSKSDAKAG
jgi:pyruvate/2-oxoglutarate dehydrogenase complex dihydrolipoamide dehydrogenase (E3) component